MRPVQKILACSVGVAGFLSAAFAHAENACRNATDIKPNELYVVVGDQLVAFSRFNPTPLRARYLTLIYASAHADTGGVVAVKQLNEALVPAGKGDVQAVALDRPAVAERCHDGRRAATRRDAAVPAREYAGYHSERRQRSDELDLFHFSYKPEGSGTCHATNDDSVGGRAHYLYSGSSVEPAYRAADVQGGGASGAVTALIDAVRRVLVPSAEASRSVAGDPGKPVARYTHLRTMLRRYDWARTGPSCVSFQIAADPAVTTTFITITDLEETPRGVYFRPQLSWKINWSGAQ